MILKNENPFQNKKEREQWKYLEKYKQNNNVKILDQMENIELH